ncbi:phosphate propanoyltransferase [Photobacterium phosphoreum]|jgi:putative phosphotransacetylase|uniref:phosphate propanoyltransferase n=1 Tax=Photobacterium phosphoreum TaxID=659 RepID=UPI0007F9349B|nr:phosphate propanoyltransferase [Photobacterium phosphoreum]MCD9462261.1 phosphate propanoyltransferase [Photobacterium phosphoreum]MCD9505973.1 phosphate propanoyltransferase [Photobacterium phosphoreum]MCD9518602.1 phosphate propanoyltransferase [Photobacterium phosphoreum]OBU37376.1 phosphate propanoyltransferase [Photobacterium phosphoreum]PSW38067.1 phosphate propanoyltransferase [Photobacterium phosphoreum]
MINTVLMTHIQERLPASKLWTPAVSSASLTGAEIGIPTGVSNRHVHLSQADIEALFGEGYQLHPLKELSQPGQFAAKECVMVVGAKGSINNVRILGPARSETQLEVSKADCYALGIKAPVRESGDLYQSADALLVGTMGYVNLQSKVICAQRHIHMSPQDALLLGVEHGQKVRVSAGQQCGLVFEQVVVRVDDLYFLEFHIDTDEANAAGIRSGDAVYLVD